MLWTLHATILFVSSEVIQSSVVNHTRIFSDFLAPYGPLMISLTPISGFESPRFTVMGAWAADDGVIIVSYHYVLQVTNYWPRRKWRVQVSLLITSTIPC